MKSIAILVASLAVVTAFAPQQHVGSSSTKLEALADQIFGMDLFSPNPDRDKYGARAKKDLKLGKIQPGKSYVPSGLTAAQYKKVREDEQKKKDDTYKRNVNKAFKFQDFDQFYLKRGTNPDGAWLKSAGRGHTFAKTKYDYSGSGKAPLADAKVPEAFTFPSIFGGKSNKAKK